MVDIHAEAPLNGTYMYIFINTVDLTYFVITHITSFSLYNKSVFYGMFSLAYLKQAHLFFFFFHPGNVPIPF